MREITHPTQYPPSVSPFRRYPACRFGPAAIGPICHTQPKEVCMKGLIAWFMGVPLFVVILLYVFGYF